MKLTHLVLIALALALAGIALAQTAPSRPQSADAAIKARLDAFVTAWNKHDGKAQAACWTADGDLIDPFGEAAKGRAEIESFFIAHQAAEMKPSTMTFSKPTVRMLGSDFAIADCDAELTGLQTPEGSAAPPLKHHVTFVLAREGNEWRFVAARPVAYAPKPGAAPMR